MRIPRSFQDTSLPAAGEECVIDERAAHHLFRVLRRRAGDAVELIDSEGRVARATLTGDAKRPGARIEALLEVAAEQLLAVTVGQCLIKADRVDWLVQKATELGVTRLDLLRSDRTDVRLPAERVTKRLQHWRAIAIGALEQCGRLRLPEIAVLDLEPWLAAQADRPDPKLVLSPAAAGADPLDGLKVSRAITVLVGPEGGLSTTEEARARGAGFAPWRLGSRILRAETAPLTALAILQHRFGDLHPGAP